MGVRRVHAILLAGLLTGGARPCAAQTPAPAPAPKDPAHKVCSSNANAGGACAPSTPPSAAQQFPYPGESSSGGAAPSPAASPIPGAPAATPDAPQSAGKQFPYPGESGSDGDSSSSSSSSSAPDANTARPAHGGDTPDGEPPRDTPSRRKLPKPTHLKSDDELEEEDVKVAKFYFGDGNDIAAYSRIKEAVKLISDDPDAFYLMGQVAGRMHKDDESREAYNRFLELEPDSRRAKAVRRTLSDAQAHR